MTDRVDCPNCGARIDRPAGFARKKIRCPGCGYYAETPPDWWEGDAPAAGPAPVDDEPRPARRAKPVPPVTAKRRADPRDTRPDFTPDDPAGEPLLAGTQDEDDDKPYAVPGTGTKPCPECNEQLPLSATFCVHCGTDLATGKRPKRTHQPMAGEWEEGPAFATRLGVFAGLLVLDAALSIWLLAVTDKFTFTDAVTQAGGQVVHVALQAFLVGSYDTLSLKRTAKGATTVLRRRRVAFVPLAPRKVQWKQSAAVGLVGSHEGGVFEWLLCVYLLGLGCLPGVLFYWFVIRPERVSVVLADVYGATDDTLYRATDRRRAADVGEFAAEATGLPFKSVM